MPGSTTEKHMLHIDEELLQEAIVNDRIICGVEAAKARNSEELGKMIDAAIMGKVIDSIAETLSSLCPPDGSGLTIDACESAVRWQYGPDAVKKVREAIYKSWS